MNHRTGTRQPGFTLIEIAVVLVLMALIASVVALSSSGLIGTATREDVFAQLESLDTAARRYARQHGTPVQLTVDPGSGRVMLVDTEQPDRPLAGYSLPKGYGLKQPWRLRRGERFMSSPLVLTYDAQGVTNTWGVTLTTPTTSDRADRGDETHHASTLLVLGLTGQTTRWEGDEQARDILARVGRRDAD